MTAPTVHIVVTCANRKRQPVPEQLHLRAARRTRLADQFSAWTKALESRSTQATPAVNLYAGEHWQIARSLPTVGKAHGYDAKLWVCSAGYGLIPGDAPLRPYAATLAPGHADSAADSAADARRWWGMLGQWPGPVPGEPRSLAALAADDPGSTIVVALSAAYLRACDQDLNLAAGNLKRRESLILIATGARVPGPADVQPCAIDARLQTALGGSLMSLGARAAGYVLETVDPDRLDQQTAATALSDLAADQPSWSRPRRTPDSDESIRGLIAERLSQEPMTKTGLLRAFRAEGRACEQGRFARLYAEVTGGR